jgi:predicted transcriptional regulator
MTTNSVLIQNVTPEEFSEFLRPIIREELSLIQQKETGPKYLTRYEVASLLKISYPTLDKYTNLGLIKSKKIGNRILYSETAIQTALQDLPQRYSKK